MLKKTLKSTLDKSVNWVIPKGTGNLEARYVRRDSKYIAAYVSSHNGCKMGCKMCFLTQLNQTEFNHTTPNEFFVQFNEILDYYDQNGEERAERVNLNFMARGEPLANRYIIKNWESLYEEFDKRAKASGLELKCNISTIMPYTVRDLKLSDFLCGNTEIYYSMYSVNPKFKKEWMPNAIDYQGALDKIKEYQESSNLPVTFHWTFIEGQNDNVDDVVKLANVLKPYNFFGKFNLVRYNAPPNLEHTKEPSEEKMLHLLEILKGSINGSRSKIVPRVGKDVYASCGMFIADMN